MHLEANPFRWRMQISIVTNFQVPIFSRLNVEKNALVAPDSVVFGYFHCTTWDTSLSLGSIRNRATFANAIGMIELLRMRDRI